MLPRCGRLAKRTTDARGLKGEKRPADLIGNAVHVMRIATVASKGAT